MQYDYTTDLTTLAACLGVSDRTIQRLAKSGVVVSTGHGEYDLAQSVQNYIARIEQQADDSADLRKAKQKSLDLDNKRKAFELEKQQGEYIELVTVQRDFTFYIAEVVRLHKAFTPVLKKRHPSVDQRVWDAVDEQLLRIRNTAKTIRISETNTVLKAEE